MKNKLAAVAIAATLVYLGLATPMAQAQAPCTLQTLVGTYAFSERGSSAVLESSSAAYPLHWDGALAPFVAIGEVSFDAYGIGRGLYWIRIGLLNSGPEPTPVEVTITELNADCTGKWQFPFSLSGITSTIEERFVAFDNGRQIRSVPTVTGVPPMAWIGEAHRISKPGEQVNACGPQTTSGTYLLTAENLVRFPATPILSDALLLRLDIAINGDYTGMLYEKFGPTGGIELPVWGRMAVNPDCSYSTDLQFTVHGEAKTAPVRGVFFDQGKKLYGLNVNAREMGTQYSFVEGQRIGD